jgi:hypothetical protein
VGVRLRHWLAVAVWTWPMAWAVALDACRCRLAHARLRQNGSLQVFVRGVAVRGGVGSRLEGERELACSRRVLAASSLHVRELNRQKTNVESRARACLERRGRRRLGVEWWQWYTSGLGGSPGESARPKGAAARAGLVGGGREDGWASRCLTLVSGQSMG